MLKEITVRNLFLMESVAVHAQDGFTAITGETGAGKSTLLDCLRLVLGRKSDLSCVRTGAESGFVSAHFELEEKATYTQAIGGILHEAGLELEGADLVLRRAIKDGKSRSFCNDQPITSTLLKTIGDALCEWHGQYDDSLQPHRQRVILDTWLVRQQPECEAILEKIETEYQQIQRVQGLLEKLEASQRDMAQKSLYAETVIRDLDPLAPEMHEESTILQELDGLQSWNRMKDRLADVVTQLPSVLKTLHGMIGSLHKVAPDDDQRLKSLEQVYAELEDVRSAYEDDLAANRYATDKLNTLEHRLGLLRHSALKWGVQPDELYTIWQEAKNFSPDSQDRTQLTSELNQHTERYNELAHTLHEARCKAAQELAGLVVSELAEMHLPHTRLEARVEKTDNTATGWDHVTFWVSFNPGQPLGPMHKVASGGERARLMLVLRTLLGQERPLLVFDEVDQGVSGATAHAMGQRLRMVGAQQQVWAITHSAQVAGQANQHLYVSKHVHDQMTLTKVGPLTKEERVHEIARLLSGQHITDESLAAAEKLMI